MATRKTTKKPTVKRRRNSGEIEAAAQLAADFHGRPPRRVRTIEEAYTQPSDLADLGKLTELHVIVGRHIVPMGFSRGVRLAASPNGGQLYIVGGDQALDLKALGLDHQLPKDHVTVGQVHQVVYRTSKAFHNFEPVDYVHEFGEEGGDLPYLQYDVLNRKLYLTGGTYQVRPEGITN